MMLKGLGTQKLNGQSGHLRDTEGGSFLSEAKKEALSRAVSWGYEMFSGSQQIKEFSSGR